MSRTPTTFASEESTTTSSTSSMLRMSVTPHSSARTSEQATNQRSTTFTAATSARTLRNPNPSRAQIDSTIDDERTARREPWIFLAIGMATAPIFAWTPFLGFMGWFLAALVHEMGHTAASWLCGMPAIPAISLTGEGASMHSDQSKLFVAVIGCGLAYAAWKFLEGNARWIAIALVVVLYPLLALTPAKDFFHLLAGHAGELAFATLCLWKTLDGGFTESRLERALYGTIGWFLVGKNAFLCFGLMTSVSARAHYNENGSFGLTNDYIRVAEDVVGWPVERVAFMMLVACVLVPPAAIVLWRIRKAMLVDALRADA